MGLFDFFKKKEAFDSIKSIRKELNNQNTTYQKIMPSLPSLNSQIGVVEPVCPYCNIKLEKFPARKIKCKNCSKDIYVRTRPFDYEKILVKEEEIPIIEKEWQNSYYIKNAAQAYEKYNDFFKKAKYKKIESNSSQENPLLIDISDEMNNIIQDRLNNFEKYLNYDEILHIKEEDRLPLLQYIWGNWYLHSSSIFDTLKFVFFEYDSKDIEIIVMKEHKKLIATFKAKNYKDKGVDFLEYYSNEERHNSNANSKEVKNWIRICYVEDMPNITDAWFIDEKHIDKYTFLITMPNLYSRLNNRKSITLKQQPEFVELWLNGKINKMSTEEFYEYCEENNIDILIEK